MYKMIRSLCIR